MAMARISRGTSAPRRSVGTAPRSPSSACVTPRRSSPWLSEPATNTVFCSDLEG